MKQYIGSYEVLRVLARGGMAVVYLARQPALDREVALKRLHLESEDPTLAQRFVREARLAAGLDHPNVVTLFDFFEHDGVPYIAMEYVGGGSLRRLVGRLELPQVLGVIEGILAGLGHAESRGIVHRDLKPENVLLSRGGTAKIADFGIARAYNALTPSFTDSGSAMGTPAYMAPEQVLDEPLGPYTDIYAAGVIAYELLAGRVPFQPDGPPLTTLYSHVHRPPPPLHELAPAVPAPVCEWVGWLLAKAPDDRPASAAAAWEALEEIVVPELGPYWRRRAAIAAGSGGLPTTVLPRDEERHAPPTPTTEVSRRRRPRVRLVTGAVAVIGAVAAAGFATLGRQPDTPSRALRGESTPPPRREHATPYDFDGDGKAQLTFGVARSGRDRAGAVVVMDGRRRQVIRPADAHLGGPYDGHEGFGRSIASGDFDGDGHADLAAAVPGRDRIAVIHGTDSGLSGGAVDSVRAGGVRIAGTYGTRIFGADMNRDGYDDLIVGAPEADPGPQGSGFAQIVYGSARGLGANRQPVLRPEESLVHFGTALRVGDVNGDGNPDLVEGAPDAPEQSVAGHATYCRGTRKGPAKCVPFAGPGSAGTSALAVADVNGDDYDDIVQGDAVAERLDGAVGGEVRLWLGGRHGPADEPVVIDQRSFPGADEPGDAFGETVGAADVDGDGYADMVVGAPGEDLQLADGVTVPDGGAFTVIRGGRSGHAIAGHAGFAKPTSIRGTPVPGEALGTSLMVVDIAGNRRPEVIVKAEGAARVEDALIVLESRRGAFAPGEARDWRPLRRGLPLEHVSIRQLRMGRGPSA
ncbi:MAG TPA: protein kinase [Solirubrobacteraceae bacterium]|nr:protein kinase [Solirubrobacteraceae bacterium]